MVTAMLVTPQSSTDSICEMNRKFGMLDALCALSEINMAPQVLRHWKIVDKYCNQLLLKRILGFFKNYSLNQIQSFWS